MDSIDIRDIEPGRIHKLKTDLDVHCYQILEAYVGQMQSDPNEFIKDRDKVIKMINSGIETFRLSPNKAVHFNTVELEGLAKNFENSKTSKEMLDQIHRVRSDHFGLLYIHIHMLLGSCMHTNLRERMEREYRKYDLLYYVLLLRSEHTETIIKNKRDELKGTSDEKQSKDIATVLIDIATPNQKDNPTQIINNGGFMNVTNTKVNGDKNITAGNDNNDPTIADNGSMINIIKNNKMNIFLVLTLGIIATDKSISMIKDIFAFFKR